MKRIIPLLILLFLSCKSDPDPLLLQHADWLESIRSNDVALGTPSEGEWLHEHHEKGQTFGQYRKANPPKCTDSNHIIYLKPVGNFSAQQQRLLELTREYVEIFFQQKTLLHQPASDDQIPEWARRQRAEGFEQLYAPYIVDTLLTGHMPHHGIVLMAISAKDLYPKEEWNYVFGLASYDKRVGVSSLYRLQNAGEDSADFTKCLLRLIKISTHEIGHMFRMKHCINARCMMNGSNNLPEIDVIPARACSECQKKLLWNLRYDNTKRLKALSGFFRRNGMTRELDYCNNDLHAAR